MKHKVKISVTNESPKGGIVTCKKKKMKRGLFKRLLGINSDNVTIIIPGDSVKDVTIQEVAGAGGAKNEWKKHSILAPSSKECVHCGFSAKFLANKEEETNDALEFGIEFHALAEAYIRKFLRIEDFDEKAVRIDELKSTCLKLKKKLILKIDKLKLQKAASRVTAWTSCH